LIILIILDEEYKLWSSSLCSFLFIPLRSKPGLIARYVVCWRPGFTVMGRHMGVQAGSVLHEDLRCVATATSFNE
jgi:hypothetical protein